MHLTPEILNNLQNSIEHSKGTFVEDDDFPNFPFGWDMLAHSPGRETTSSPVVSVSSHLGHWEECLIQGLPTAPTISGFTFASGKHQG